MHSVFIRIAPRVNISFPNSYDILPVYQGNEIRSRRLIEVHVTSRSPYVSALRYTLFFKGIPRCIIMDARTENIDVIDMQMALRLYHGDTYSGEKSVIAGSSHSNQTGYSFCNTMY